MTCKQALGELVHAAFYGHYQQTDKGSLHLSPPDPSAWSESQMFMELSLCRRPSRHPSVPPSVQTLRPSVHPSVCPPLHPSLPPSLISLSFAHSAAYFYQFFSCDDSSPAHDTVTPLLYFNIPSSFLTIAITPTISYHIRLS